MLSEQFSIRVFVNTCVSQTSAFTVETNFKIGLYRRNYDVVAQKKVFDVTSQVSSDTGDRTYLSTVWDQLQGSIWEKLWSLLLAGILQHTQWIDLVDMKIEVSWLSSSLLYNTTYDHRAVIEKARRRIFYQIYSEKIANPVSSWMEEAGVGRKSELPHIQRGSSYSKFNPSHRN